jgi:hypothetical protein
MIQEKGMTSSSFENPQLEQKTTSEISEQKRILTAMVKNKLQEGSRKDFVNNLNNKLWISKDSYDELLQLICKLNTLSPHCDYCGNSKNIIYSEELCKNLNLSFTHFQLGIIKELNDKNWRKNAS